MSRCVIVSVWQHGMGDAIGEAADADGPLLLLSSEPESGCTFWKFAYELKLISDLNVLGDTSFIAEAGLEQEPLIPLARCLLSEGRSVLMARLRELAPQSLPRERHCIVDALTTAVRHGRLTPKGDIPVDYECAASRMPSALRRAIVDAELSKEVSPDDVLVAELNTALAPKRTRRDGLEVLKRKHAISASGCAALRACVDAERSRSCDSVDQLAEHQLNCSKERLEELIGKESARRLFALPDDLFALRRDAARRRRAARTEAAASRHAELSSAAASSGTDAGLGVVSEAAAPAGDGCESSDTPPESDAGEGGYYVDMFIRRYTRDTRPWIGFHCDVSTVTANISLNDDGDYEGGR